MNALTWKLWRSLLLKTLWAHFWLSDTFFTSRGSNSPVSRVSCRKIYDVNLVHTSLRRKIYQRLFYGEKSIIVQCTLKVVLKSSNISRRHLYDVIIFSMTRYVVIITPTWNYDVRDGPLEKLWGQLMRFVRRTKPWSCLITNSGNNKTV